ncbi:PKD-like domain-containing protein, partial [Flavobacterium pedocola]
MPKRITFYKFFLAALVFFLGNSLFAQETCATATTVTDLTGATCATSAVGTVNDIGSGGCEEGVLDTWFSFVAQGGTATINVSATAAGFRPEVVVASSSNGTCAGTFSVEGCFDGAGNYTVLNGSVVNGLTPGVRYWIIVSSNGDVSTGTLSVCVNNPVVSASCTNNQTCGTATAIPLNAPGGGAACVTDCNNGANVGPDFTGNNCYDLPNPTVWYSITTGASTASLNVSVTSATMTTPEFSVFTNNCVLFTNVGCVEGSGGTATGNNIPVAANTTYLIAVSNVSGSQGTFDLCITQNADASACNTTDALTVTATSMGSPLGGPYQPGEQVTFQYTVTNWQQINCNYIGAFVPTFGNCWAASSFNAQGMPVNIITPLNVNGTIQPCPPGPPCAWSGCVGSPSGSWNWFPAGSVTYNVNGYYPAGTPMPAGWYFLSSYSPATGACIGDPTDPDNTYGDGNFPACGTNTFDYTIRFVLTAGGAANCTAGTTDCTVSIKTFGDGEFGTWNNIGCTVDLPSTAPASLLCCTPPVMTSLTSTAICNNTNVNFALTADVPSTFSWVATANANVTGESTTAQAGATITDVLVNITAIPQIVTYTVTPTSNPGGCVGTPQTVSVTVNPPSIITLTSAAATANQTVCVNNAITNITYSISGSATGAGVVGLPAGVTGSFAAGVFTISGTPTASGTFNYTVTTTGGCVPAVTATGTITVNLLNTIAAGVNRTLCINTAMTNITLATTGATGATFAGLPAGVTGSWAANVATISGTPTASGTFNYTVTTTGGCPPATATGTITVNPLNTIVAGTSQTVCINTAITTINLATTGATGATFAGLPAGVTGSWAANTATISGTPTAAGTFNYTVTTTGGCPPATATGTITVNPQNTIAAGTSQTVCINTAITTINLATTGATGATFAGLPAGVTGSWAANTATISGTPTAVGTFNYTVTTTGGCPPATATGTITVNPQNTIAAGTSQTVCINTAITTINLATTGATGATFAGLPAGVTGSWAANTATIS